MRQVLNLPLFLCGATRALGLSQDHAPERAAVRELRQSLDGADAFIIVTPEYNRSQPGALKVLIDSAHDEWGAKPVSFVPYGGISEGLRAAEQLRPVFAELHAVTIRNIAWHEGIIKFLTIIILLENKSMATAENSHAFAFSRKFGRRFRLLAGRRANAGSGLPAFEGTGSFLRRMHDANAARAYDAASEASMIGALDVQCQSCRTPPARGRSGFLMT